MSASDIALGKTNTFAENVSVSRISFKIISEFGFRAIASSMHLRLIATAYFSSPLQHEVITPRRGLMQGEKGAKWPFSDPTVVNTAGQADFFDRSNSVKQDRDTSDLAAMTISPRPAIGFS